MSLEKLNHENEKNWTVDYIEEDINGKLHLGEKFFKYKQELDNLQNVLEKNFNRTMQDIRNGLPDVVEDGEDDETDFNFGGTSTGEWTCRTC